MKHTQHMRVTKTKWTAHNTNLGAFINCGAVLQSLLCCRPEVQHDGNLKWQPASTTCSSPRVRAERDALLHERPRRQHTAATGRSNCWEPKTPMAMFTLILMK
eukprot:1370114-Amphidinium_carterae.1